jgi:hypothetical protein
MQSQNIHEYKLVREELFKLKDCITTYIGFVIGGASAAFLSIVAMHKSDISNISIGCVCFLLSTIVTLVLMVLLYKFNSHNRFAGYCKLLNQELLKYQSGFEPKDPEQFLAWEISMDIIRESDFKKDILKNKCKNLNILGLSNDKVKSILESFTEKANDNKFKEGLLIIWSVVTGKSKTKSWQYPSLVLFIFLVLNLIFLIIGIYFMRDSILNFLTPKETFLFIFTFIFLSFQFYFWGRFISNISSLMNINGSCTIDAYCWKFLPIRYEYIIEQNDKIIYDLITLKNPNF